MDQKAASHKPDKDKRKRQQKRRSKRTLTHAVTHIRLMEANPGKLEALDRLVTVYLALCQHYVTHFCTEADPNSYAVRVFETELSERWHRVAIQQAAGIARAYRTNRQNASDAYLEDLTDYAQAQAKATASGVPLDPKVKEPQWSEWNLPELRVPAIQADANVVVLEPSEDSTFDYWLCISTLEKGNPLRVPVKLASYHRKALAGRTINTSTALHKRDREKRRRKAKLRACLKKKGGEKLPSASSASGQRLGRHVRQEINRAINQMLKEHADARIIFEDLSVASMRFKARAMNAYVYASNLAHIPKQLAWATAKRGMAAHTVKAAYSSQECHRCHYVDRANRPDQSTFNCVVCGYRNRADRNAALNLSSCFGDQELATCKSKAEVKALLLKRHEAWKKKNGLSVVQPPAQWGL
jgi:Putative transposase DNA-binding domain